MLARAPSAAAKTRLAADVGAVAADQLYRAMLADLFANLAPGEHRVVPFVDGDTDAFRAASGWRGPVRAQPAGDLGGRIAGAVDGCRLDGAGSVLVIGTDAPQVAAVLIDRAATLLRACDVVVGRAVDGGFYLLGVAAHVEVLPLLRGLAWGTAGVLASLRANAERATLAVRSLEAMVDLDRVADLRRFLPSHESRGCPRVRASAARLGLPTE